MAEARRPRRGFEPRRGQLRRFAVQDDCTEASGGENPAAEDLSSHMGTENQHHTAPELAELDDERQATDEDGAEVIAAIKKTFDHWTMIGRGVAILRREADRLGGRNTFHSLLEKNGYGVLVRSKAGLTRLVQITERED